MRCHRTKLASQLSECFLVITKFPPDWPSWTSWVFSWRLLPARPADCTRRDHKTFRRFAVLHVRMPYRWSCYKFYWKLHLLKEIIDGEVLRVWEWRMEGLSRSGCYTRCSLSQGCQRIHSLPRRSDSQFRYSSCRSPVLRGIPLSGCLTALS